MYFIASSFWDGRPLDKRGVSKSTAPRRRAGDSLDLAARRGLCEGCLRLGEMLAQRVGLSLVCGPDRLPIEHVGGLDHPFERELTDALPVLDHERDVVCPHLERGAGPVEPSTGVEPESRVEETGVVGAELPAGRVVRRHL